MDEKSVQIKVRRVENRKNRCLEASWGVLARLGASWGAMVRFWKTFLETLGRSWAQHGPSWSQVGSKLRPRWAMLAPRWPCWAQFGSFWGGPGSTFDHFFCDLWNSDRSVKMTNAQSLLVFFCGLGPPLESPGGCLGSVSGAMLEGVGSKMVLSWLS